MPVHEPDTPAMGARPRVSATVHGRQPSGDVLAGEYLPEPVEAADEEGFRIVVPILGMTCRACEQRISRHVGKLRYVESVAASASRGRVVIESSQPLAFHSIERAIRLAGYEIGEAPWLDT